MDRRNPDVEVAVQHGEKDMVEVKAAAKRELGQIAGVQGFGVGDNSLRVYLRDDDARGRLPAAFQGVPIEPVVVGTITALPAEKATKLPILFVIAQPDARSRLRVGAEAREVSEAIASSPRTERLSVELSTAARPADLSREVLAAHPWVIHFSGHGDGAGELHFEDESGREAAASPGALESFFAALGGGVECVVLNACYSEPQAKAIAKHVPWVIGTDREFGDRAATAFSVAFYGALGAGMEVPRAFDAGRASARLQGLPERLSPVLFARAA